ncbi:MAG: hypothetical protein J5705_06620, partial [Bacteroidaceae bacterium]|nr:hypothetical protein [Bacteroidaceae bacterium]
YYLFGEVNSNPLRITHLAFRKGLGVPDPEGILAPVVTEGFQVPVVLLLYPVVVTLSFILIL